MSTETKSGVADRLRHSRPRRRPEPERLHIRNVRLRTLTDAVRSFLDHHLNDWAAALTF